MASRAFPKSLEGQRSGRRLLGDLLGTAVKREESKTIRGSFVDNKDRGDCRLQLISREEERGAEFTSALLPSPKRPAMREDK